MIKRFKQYSIWTVLSVAMAGGAGPAKAYDMGFYLTEPESPYVSYEGTNIWAAQQGIHRSTSVPHLKAKLKFKADCDENYVVQKVIVTGTHDEGALPFKSDGYGRREYFTLDGFKIFTHRELTDRCATLPEGKGSFTVAAKIAADLQCNNPYENLGFDFDGMDRKNKTYDVTMNLQVNCTPSTTAAIVKEHHWTYECPSTDRSNEAYWQKYRFVVEGTDYRYITSNKDLGSPRCIRAYQSDMSNNSSVLTSQQ